MTILTKSLPRVGTVLVSKQGFALYMFVPDGRKDVTCTGVCAATWPPVKVPAGAALSAGSGVKSALLGSDPDPAGGRVLTYAGWPLYTYTGDVQAGQPARRHPVRCQPARRQPPCAAPGRTARRPPRT